MARLRSVRLQSAILVATCLIGFLLLGGCKDKSVSDSTPIGVRIGYRASLPADVGALWATESGSLREIGFDATTEGFGRPAVLLQALRNGAVDVVTVMPLESVLEDIRKGEANYFIYVLQCFSPTAEFDAIVVNQSLPGDKTSWAPLEGKTLGVIPAEQNILIGEAIARAVGVSMEVGQYNPQNALLSLSNHDFDAIHALGADVARARADSVRFAVLEACPASRHVFGGKLVPAGAGLISKQWVAKNPGKAQALIGKILHYTEKALANPQNPQLVAVLEKEKYGRFEPDVLQHLAFTPVFGYSDVKADLFEPMLAFLTTQQVAVPSVGEILEHVYKAE